MRQALGENFKPEMMNTPEARLTILGSLIDQRLLLLEAGKNRLLATDDTLREVIRRIPALQDNGQFSKERYETALRAQGTSQPQFEAKLRQDLILQQLVGAVGDTAFVSDSQAEMMLKIQSEERQFAEFRMAQSQFAAKVAIDGSAVQKYYEDNQAMFEVPEQRQGRICCLVARSTSRQRQRDRG